MGFDNRPTDRQPHSYALRFRREERLEYAVERYPFPSPRPTKARRQHHGLLF
jgi:hypothetical protein